MQEHWLIVGTYTDGGASRGIYRARFNARSGTFGSVELLAETENPSFLAAHEDCLYAVNENGEANGQPAGAVSAFSFDRRNGALEFLNQQSTGGSYPCHLIHDRDLDAVIVANYGSGTVATFSIEADGQLSARRALFNHKGHGPDEGRQEGPHAHSVAVPGHGDCLFAPDLGADALIAYQRAGKRQLLRRVPALDVDCPPGSGPRHFVFNDTSTRGYLITELSNQILTFDFAAETGRLDLIGQTSTLPPGFTGTSSCADIHLSPDGKFLYGSNRGHDSIAIFVIDQATGLPALVGHTPTGGGHPRNFCIHPAGEFLLVANRDADQIVSFAIDQSSGRLTRVSETTSISRPVCLILEEKL